MYPNDPCLWRPPCRPRTGRIDERYGLLTSAVPRLVSRLVLLTFIRSHVTTTRVLMVRTRLAALIGFQQMTVTSSAASRVARINRRASRENSHRLGIAAVVVQGAEHRVGVIQVAGIAEVACVIAAQVVAIREHGPRAVSSRRAVRDDSVL